MDYLCGSLFHVNIVGLNKDCCTMMIIYYFNKNVNVLKKSQINYEKRKLKKIHEY